MKVLVVGEGPHELGDGSVDGALIALVRRVVPSVKAIESDRVSNPALGRIHGKGNGYTKRAIRWMLEAERRGFDALVLVIDEDGDHDRVRAIDQAQEFGHASVLRALGVAIRSFDAWMLADEAALSAVLGRAVPTQPDPESERDPKSRCLSLIGEGQVRMAPREIYSRVATSARVKSIEDRCPRGFGVFAIRLRALDRGQVC